MLLVVVVVVCCLLRVSLFVEFLFIFLNIFSSFFLKTFLMFISSFLLLCFPLFIFLSLSPRIIKSVLVANAAV